MYELRNERIVALYKKNRTLTRDIAKKFGLSDNRIRAIVKKHNAMRSNAESNRILAKRRKRINYDTGLSFVKKLKYANEL